MTSGAVPWAVTERLCLGHWVQSDLQALSEMNADPKVMAHFPSPLNQVESARQLQRLRNHQAKHGFTAWPIHTLKGEFIGLCGLLWAEFEAPFTPAVEISWRFRPEFWGQGYAHEAAKRVISEAFGPLNISSLVSFTAETNQKSWRLMERLGMKRDRDFEHPSLDPSSQLLRHRLYRLSRKDWEAAAE